MLTKKDIEAVREMVHDEIRQPEPLLLTARQAASLLGLSRSMFYLKMNILTRKYRLRKMTIGTRGVRFARANVLKVASLIGSARKL